MKPSLQPVACFLCCCVTVIAQDAGVVRQKPSRMQCDAWVQQLANRSERPFTESYVLKRPRNIDRQALADVKAAYDNLSLHFFDALPSLLGSLNDHRYAYYQEVPSNGAFVCEDVSDACYALLFAHIEIYRRELTVLDPTGVPRSVHFLSAMGGVKKWYAARREKSLFELQLEAVDWALKQPRDDGIEQAAWDRAVADLRKFRDEFAKGQKPFDPQHTLSFEGK